jgi:hypothetical protein
MIDIQPHFFKQCPKCKTKGINFQLINCSTKNSSFYCEYFYNDEWREYDFEMFSASSLCTHCNHYVSANIAVKYDPVKNATASIIDFCNDQGKLIENSDLIISFDVPPLLPSPNYLPSAMAEAGTLLKQAERCYDIHAWEAVGMLCRKIIDIESKRIWLKNKPTELLPDLSTRLQILFLKRHIGRIDYAKLNYKKRLHKLFYRLDTIRDNGNDAAHGNLTFDVQDAEAILVFTKHVFDDLQEL